MSHETKGMSNEWYTPRYIFDGLGCVFDMDVAPAKEGPSHVPSVTILVGDGLTCEWTGFVWMNPPFGARNGLVPWLDKFFRHGNGVALTPDRSGAPWWQDAARKAGSLIMVSPKVRFIRPDGTVGKSPSNGTTLFAAGPLGNEALKRADGVLGIALQRYTGERT